MNMEVKVLDKILKYLKSIIYHNQMEFIPGIKAGSTVKNQLLYHINRLKNHTSISTGAEKTFDKIQHPLKMKLSAN